jgi:glutamate-1-semialdehyde 2,1-aminomutase
MMAGKASGGRAMATTTDRTGTTGANRFLDTGSATAQLHETATAVIPGGTSRIHYHFQPYPIYARAGKGCVLTDAEGVPRLDFLNNMTSLIHGHGHPAVKAAIVDQLERGTAFSEPSEGEVGLAKLIVDRVASVERIRFSNSGTEAVMFAIKLARAFTGRSRIAKFEGFYHGYYDYVQVSFNSAPSTWGDADEPNSVASSGGLADGVTGDILTLPYNNRDAVQRLLERHGHELAALIVDPLSNRAGFPRPGEGFLEFLREITRQYGIVLIFDEVISFRVAHGGAQERYGGDPDLTTFGKVIGGGLPVGAVGGRAEVMALLDPSNGAPRVISGGTFSGNPLTMAAGQAAMEAMTPAEYERINGLGERLRSESNRIFAAAGVPGQVTGDGSLFRVLLTHEPVVDYRSSVRGALPAGTMATLHRELLDAGIIISNTGLACLSTAMGEPEVDAFLSALERAVERIKA